MPQITPSSPPQWIADLLDGEKEHQRCLLCGNPPSLICVFVPHEMLRFGAPPGKKRYILYSLCSDCSGDPESLARVEKIIENAINSR